MQQTVITQSRIDHSNAKAAIMSTNHESTTAVFNAFIEASKALDELPRVKADLEAAQALAAETETKLNTWRNKSDVLADQLNALRSELAAKEADLAQATKSNADLAKVVDLIRGALPSVPVSASTDDRPSDMSTGAVSTANTEGAAGAARLNPDQYQSEARPTSGTTQTSTTNTDTTTQGNPSSPSNTSTESSSSVPQGQRDTDPMNQNQPSATANNNTTQPHPADSPNAGGTTGQQAQDSGDREPLGEASIGSTGTASMSAHTQSGISSSPEPRRPHWTKPNEQSWQSWVNNGGEPAPWMR